MQSSTGLTALCFEKGKFVFVTVPLFTCDNENSLAVSD